MPGSDSFTSKRSFAVVQGLWKIALLVMISFHTPSEVDLSVLPAARSCAEFTEDVVTSD